MNPILANLLIGGTYNSNSNSISIFCQIYRVLLRAKALLRVINDS